MKLSYAPNNMDSCELQLAESVDLRIVLLWD
jgi:hypothetical protein